jgi:hypothetical protein
MWPACRKDPGSDSGSSPYEHGKLTENDEKNCDPTLVEIFPGLGLESNDKTLHTIKFTTKLIGRS